MSKRILSLVLALVMVLGTFGTVFAAPTDNVKVDWLIEEGLVQGYGDGTYGLDKSITRAEVTAIVTRALDLEEVAEASASFASPFTDMNAPAVMWARGYVTVIAGQGIVEGYPNGQFRPSNPITYAEISAMMVRLMGGLTEAEEANAVWPTTYLAKAVQLGVYEGITGITDYNAPATREKVFEMMYNAIVSKQIGNYTIVKGIVLENNRVERLAKDEIVVEVIKEVQRANQLDATIYERGDQEKLVIEAKVGDAENLLGRVADFTLDKDGKVISIKIDETYKMEIVQAKATKNKFGNWTVEIGERYEGSDERIYRTYLNNKAYAYEDFYRLNPDNRDEYSVDYARTTVKNGKVLFIDAFNFDDVMPVKEVKDIRSKATIVSYDDVREGNTIETTVSDKEVILVKNNMFTKGTLNDVKMDNVIHTFKEGTTTQYLVLQDLAIEGKFERVTETSTVTSVVVDGKAYAIPTVSPKKAVYEFKSNDKFYTLEANTAYRELDTFRGEEVRALLGLDGKLQYIGSQVTFGDFVGVATRIVGKEMRVLNPENKLNDYTATLDTRVDALTTAGTGHQNLNEIMKNALVYVNANDMTLVEVIELMNPVNVSSLSTRNITLANAITEKIGNANITNSAFRITDDTAVYVINNNGVAEVRTMAQVVKAYDAAVLAGRTVTASLVSEGRYDSVSIRGDKYARNDNAFAIAFYNLDIAPQLEDAVYGKLLRFYDRRAGQSEIVVQLTNGSEATFTLDRNIENNVDFKVGLYYEIQESKDTDGLAVRVNKVNFSGHGVINNIRGNVYTIDSNEFYEVRATEFFGRTPRIGDRISYVNNANDDLLLVVYPAVESEDIVTGKVTYINPTGTRLEVDRVVYVLDSNTRLLDEGGNTIGYGNQDIAEAPNNLVIDDLVKDIKVVNGVVTSLVKIDADEFYNVRNATAAVVKAEDSKLEADKTAAYVLVNALQPGVTKTALLNRLAAIVTEVPVTALDRATAAVAKAEASLLQADINSAQALVTALPASTDKASLQARLNVLVALTNVERADRAVAEAEVSKLQADIDAAQALVTALPASADKVALQARINAIVPFTDVQLAQVAVNKADVSGAQADIDAAQTLVTALPAGTDKASLQATINYLVSQIQALANATDGVEMLAALNALEVDTKITDVDDSKANDYFGGKDLAYFVSYAKIQEFVNYWNVQ